MAEKPHDYEFFTAPIGNRLCDYEKVITKVMWWQIDGVSQRSVDGGKTCEVRVPGTCDYATMSYGCGDPIDPAIGQVPIKPSVTGVYINWRQETD